MDPLLVLAVPAAFALVLVLGLLYHLAHQRSVTWGKGATSSERTPGR